MPVSTVEAYWVPALAVTKGRLGDALPIEDLGQKLRFLKSICEFILLLQIVGALLFGLHGFLVVLYYSSILFECYRGCWSNRCRPVSHHGLGDCRLLWGYLPVTDLTWNKVAYTDLTMLALVQVWFVRDRFAYKGCFLCLITKRWTYNMV